MAAKRGEHLERGQVIAIGELECLIYFVDKGDSAFIKREELYKIPSNLIHVPPIAYVCCVSGINASSLFAQKVAYFCQLFPIGRSVLVHAKDTMACQTCITVDLINLSGRKLYPK